MNPHAPSILANHTQSADAKPLNRGPRSAGKASPSAATPESICRDTDQIEFEEFILYYLHSSGSRL
jgi:hypothetical protein